MRTLALAATLAALTFGSAAVSAQELPAAPAAASNQALQRAQVLAELELWQASGMTYLPSASASPEITASGEYQRALARYEQLRNGPAFQQAVARNLERGPQLARQ